MKIEHHDEIAGEENRWLKTGLFLFVCILACIGYYRFFIITSLVEVELHVTEKTPFKLYWSENQEPYSEERMEMAEAVPGKSKYTFFLTDLDDISTLRVDTHQYVGKATLGSIKITQEGWQDIIIDPPHAFAKLSPLSQVKATRSTGLATSRNIGSGSVRMRLKVMGVT